MTRAAILLALLVLLATGCDDGVFMAGEDSGVALMVTNDTDRDLVIWIIEPESGESRQLRDLDPAESEVTIAFDRSRQAQAVCDAPSDPVANGAYEVRTLDGEVVQFIEARFCDDNGDVSVDNFVTITPDMLPDAN